MIYFTYKIQFIGSDTHTYTVAQTKACEDVDYDATLDEAKLIVTQQAWAVNNFVVVTSYTETTTIITELEYLKLVADPDGAYPIDNWDPEIPLENIN
jgi:hypothetical protein